MKNENEASKNVSFAIPERHMKGRKLSEMINLIGCSCQCQRFHHIFQSALSLAFSIWCNVIYSLSQSPKEQEKAIRSQEGFGKLQNDPELPNSLFNQVTTSICKSVSVELFDQSFVELHHKVKTAHNTNK